MEQIKQHRTNLCLSALAANLLYISVGCALAWPSAAVPLIMKEGFKSYHITWMVSLLMLGACFGPTIYSYSIDKFGRKFSLLLTGVIFLFSWIIIGVSTDVYALCAGRFVGGLALGSAFNCVPVYISEISDVGMRQTLTSCTEIFICIGCVIQYAAGPWLSYEMLALVSAAPGLVFVVAMIRTPESPYFIMRNGKKREALETLVWLRGPSYPVREELDLIEKSVMESNSQTGRHIDLIQKKGPRKALLLGILMFVSLHFTAKGVLASYLGPILTDTSLPITSKMATTIIGVMQWVFGACEPLVVHRFGSKKTLVICSYCCAVFLLSFGVYKYFDERHYKISSLNLRLTPIICIILFDLFFELGVGCLPWAITVELFPPSLKGFGINVVTSVSWLVDFIVVTLYGNMAPKVGASYCFMFSSAVLIVGTTLIAVLVPNTKGLALHKIHDELEGSSKD